MLLLTSSYKDVVSGYFCWPLYETTGTLDTRTYSSVCILVSTSIGNNRDSGYLFCSLVAMTRTLNI